MLTVLGIWAAYMLTYLVKGTVPEPALWGVPGGVWLALNPPFVFGKKNDIKPEASEMEK